MKYQIYYGTEPIKELFDKLGDAEDELDRLAEEDYLADSESDEPYEYYLGFYEIREVQE